MKAVLFNSETDIDLIVNGWGDPMWSPYIIMFALEYWSNRKGYTDNNFSEFTNTIYYCFNTL